MNGKQKRFSIKPNRKQLTVLFAGILALIPYGARLFQYSISIDTEMMINTPQRILTSWLYHERPGLVISKHLFGQTTFHYMVEIAGTWIFLIAACLVWQQAAGKSILVRNAEAHRLSGRENVAGQGTSAGDVTAHSLPGQASFDWIFPLLFLTHPVVTEQIHFILQSMEVAWAILLCMIAAGWLAAGWQDIWLKKDRSGEESRRKIGRKSARWKIPLGMLALVWAFCSYQSLVPLYIAAAAGLYLLQMEHMTGKYWPLALSQAGTFLAAFLLSRCASKIGLYTATGSFTSTAYVSGMVQWGARPAIECIKELYHYGRAILLGEGPYYTFAYLTVLAGTILMWLMGACKSRRYLRVTYVLAGIIFYLTPFLLPLYLGGADQKRAQVTLAFVLAFGWWYLIRLAGQVPVIVGERTAAVGLTKKDELGEAAIKRGRHGNDGTGENAVRARAENGAEKDKGINARKDRNSRSNRNNRIGKGTLTGAWMAALAVLCAILFAGLQWSQSWRLNQTAYSVYQQEQALTEAICEAIQETGAPEDAKVQIVGRWSPVLTENMVSGETIGWSFYEWDADKAYGSTERVVGLWNTLGYRYQTVDIIAAADGVAAANSMPVWPEEGAVRWDGSTVIVRVGY